MITTWQEAELIAAEHMSRLGFEAVDVTPAGADGGVDVSASGARAQVKFYSSGPIGAPAVQQLVGATAPGHVSLFYSLSGYTRAAMALATEKDVALFVFSVSGDVSPVSSRAFQLVESGAFTWKSPHETQLIGVLRSFLQAHADVALEVGGLAVAELQPRLVDSLDAQGDPQQSLREVKAALSALGEAVEVLNSGKLDVRDVVQNLGKVIAIYKWLCDFTGVDFGALESRVLASHSSFQPFLN